jgi:hypothetical protein
MRCPNTTDPETVKCFSKMKPVLIIYCIGKGHACCPTTPIIYVCGKFGFERFYTSSHFLVYCKAQHIRISDFPEKFSSKISTLKTHI